MPRAARCKEPSTDHCKLSCDICSYILRPADANTDQSFKFGSAQILLLVHILAAAGRNKTDGSLQTPGGRLRQAGCGANAQERCSCCRGRCRCSKCQYRQRPQVRSYSQNHWCGQSSLIGSRAYIAQSCWCTCSAKPSAHCQGIPPAYHSVLAEIAPICIPVFNSGDMLPDHPDWLQRRLQLLSCP